MKKELVIDPEWESEESGREEYVPRPRPARGEPEELDPFGVGLPPDIEPPFDPDQPDGDVFLYGGREDEPDSGATGERLHEKPTKDTPGNADDTHRREDRPQEDPFARRDEDIPASKAKEWLGMLLSGSILTRGSVRRSYPYLLMVAFLTLLYISGLFRMQQLHRRESQLRRQVKELRATSLELSASRMNATRRSSILLQIDQRGIPLTESIEAPKIIDE